MLWSILDFFWPSRQPATSAQREERRSRDIQRDQEINDRINALPDDTKQLECCLGESRRLLEEETARRQSVEGRLTSIVGLSSIAATISFGTIAALATGTVRTPSEMSRWVLVFGALYLSGQLCCAVFAAIKGLERQSYLKTDAVDAIPELGESESQRLRRMARSSYHVLTDSANVDNTKVTQMAISHRAMKNFVGGLLLFVALATAMGIRGGTGESATDDLIRRLKTNSELREMLRGPTGELGLRGPAGEPCGVAPARQPGAGRR
jgi:hypothetical protein